jgi:nucleotide-binding universal stress UspA family protein
MRVEQKQARPVVCGTDFSAAATESVDIAAAMAKRLGTKLFLVHVDEFLGLGAVDPKLFDAAFSRRRADLDKEIARLRGAGTVVEERLLSGSAFDGLATVAAESNARLIVVGAVGHGVTRRLLVGSVAERTAETSNVPTLVVRPGGRLGSWLGGEHRLGVLVGCDFSVASDAALHWVGDLCAIGPCEITVLHADWPPEAAERLGYRGSMSLTENPKEVQAALERDLSKRVAQFLPSGDVTLKIGPAWGRPEESLLETANRQNVDLVVVGTHRRRGLGLIRFGSVSRAILHHAAVSVAVIPPAGNGKVREQQS